MQTSDGKFRYCISPFGSGGVSWSLAVMLTCLFQTVSATVELSGVLKKDMRWSADKSPYVITGDLVIPRNVRVVVSPGTWVLVDRPSSYRYKIPQRDRLDSLMVSITVRGIFNCVGRRDQRIVFSSGSHDSLRQCTWYGLVLSGALDGLTEIAFTDIAGSCNGAVVENCRPVIRNCVFEFNNIGITCQKSGHASIINNVITRNFSTGIKIKGANPKIYNNIVVHNGMNGVWGDKVSRIDMKYNCLYKNGDGNVLECDPRLGILEKKNKNGDSTDFAHNLYTDPVFAGSAGDSLAVERDITMPTDKARIRDTTLAKVLNPTLADSSATRRRRGRYARYSLSSYSPCIDAGHKGGKYRDADGSRNDMGIYGGTEIRAGVDGF